MTEKRILDIYTKANCSFDGIYKFPTDPNDTKGKYSNIIVESYLNRHYDEIVDSFLEANNEFVIKNDFADEKDFVNDYEKVVSVLNTFSNDREANRKKVELVKKLCKRYGYDFYNTYYLEAFKKENIEIKGEYHSNSFFMYPSYANEDGIYKFQKDMPNEFWFYYKDTYRETEHNYRLVGFVRELVELRQFDILEDFLGKVIMPMIMVVKSNDILKQWVEYLRRIVNTIAHNPTIQSYINKFETMYFSGNCNYELQGWGKKILVKEI